MISVKKQLEFFRQSNENLNVGEFVGIIDFAENFSLWFKIQYKVKLFHLFIISFLKEQLNKE